MSTITAVRKGGRVAIAADALTTFEELKFGPAYDASPGKIVEVDGSYLGVVGFTAHALVLESVLAEYDLDFSSRRAVFETFRALHPVLKDEYFLRPEANEDDPYESSQLTVLIANAHGLFGVYDLREVHEFSRFWAMGSGQSYALGAMYAGWDGHDARALAELGVRAGCEFDRDSGPPVVSFEVELATAGAVAPAPAERRSLHDAGRRRRRRG